MLITPAIASEPYWAAAPSRSTSIRSIAAAGIAFRSTPTVPRPNVPLTCTNALEWRRLPLTSTSTWSGEAAQARRIDVVRAVGDGLVRRVEGRCERREDLVHLG